MPDKTAYQVITEFLQSEEAADPGSSLFTRDDCGDGWCIDGNVMLNLLAEKIELWAATLSDADRTVLLLKAAERK